MKSGFVALVGRSNVGKSTLMNTLVGTKIAATSFRAQMTRHIIHGVMNRPEGQAVFVDLPGLFQDKKNALSAKLFNRIKEGLEGVDLIIYVVDPGKEIGTEERAVIGLIRHLPIPKILVINKSDLPARNREFAQDYESMADDFTTVMTLSALRGSHIEPLKDKVMELLPEGELLYEGEQLTNVTDTFFVAELIREKIFSVFDKEVPYTMSVEVDEMEQKPNDPLTGKPGMLVITARILTEAERYKKVIIGTGGSKIKEIGQMSRKELEAALGRDIYLDLQVEVDPHWIERL
jgi:GTP-binding protein Era